MWLGGADVGAQVTGYGPLMIATAGLATALISGFTRRDRRQVDQTTVLDQRTNTALKGLDTALQRVESERTRWEEEATRERLRADALEDEVAALRAQLAARGRQGR